MQAPLPLNRKRFPWRGGNRFDLLVDGSHFFPAMLTAIKAARRYILLEMYLVESGMIASEFIDALTSAARRGAQVYVLLDDFGARGLLPSDRQRLLDAGVHLAFYNPLHYGKLRRNLWRDHRKLLLVDGVVAYTGGAGITDEFAPTEPLHWHDVMLAVRGPCVADWHTAFEQVWHLNQGNSRNPTPPLPLPPPAAGAAPGHSAGRVTLNEPIRMEIKRSLLKRLRGAERRIWIASAYFIPSWKIRRALYQAARQGCDVRLLLPGPHTDHPGVRHAGRRYYTKLLAAGVRIFEYQPRFLHAKILLCDTWVSIGSSNIDRWNFSWNLEANQEVEDHALAEQVAALFEADFTHSREFLAGEWRQRSWRRRLQERFWGFIELWLERLSQRRP
ncbi:phospholipase D-like domain-containing protein [Sulfurivermis fontis]|uniref:phospholipase D-like domain-containing protein n=1 Tax=Sulfurivermis fontis TaxID=1972068 RepID=UPI000FD9F7B1|nr:phosphatidylserine/phosphatidylglycerophosphate/cardiolipin synthase family protein [Sulfurivermis fontis]